MLLSIYAIKQAGLSLQKRQGFVATVVTTMGTTLGALICVLTLAYLLFFQPLPYPDQDRIVLVEHTLQNDLGVEEVDVFTFPSFLHLYEHQNVFEQSALIYYHQNVLTSLRHQPTVPVAFITPEFMDIFNVPMALGRRFDQREAIDTEHQVAILSYSTWQNDFNGDEKIIGTKVDFKGRSFEVVGVTGKEFVEAQSYRKGVDTAVWFPWDLHLAQGREKSWILFDRIVYLAKLKPEYNAIQAGEMLTPMMDSIWQNNPEIADPIKDWSVVMLVRSYSSILLGNSANVIYFLLAGVLGLVIIACANITNLFVARTAEQQSRLAIQAALGAKKSHLLQAILAEASILMCASVMVALIIANAGFQLMQTHLDGLLPRVSELTINSVSVCSALIFAALFSALFALISGKMINYRALNAQLQSSGKGTGVQVSKSIRQILIISQVAIAMVLVFANMSLFNTAYDEITTETGFSVDNIYHTSFSVSAPVYPDDDVVQPIMREIEKQLLLLPQVEKVDISFSPLARFFNGSAADARNDEQISMQLRPVGDQYIDMINQPLLAGEYFSRGDLDSGNRVAVVNETLANTLHPEGDAIGLNIDFNSGARKIIGIVQDVIYPGETESANRLYFPTLRRFTKMNIQVAPGQSLSRVEVVEAIKAVTPLYALYGLELLSDTKNALLFSQYTTVVTTAALAIITLFLAAIGLYGILSYGTQMRRFELGTRMAIGAKGRDIIYLIVKENVHVIMFGVLISSVILLAIYLGFSGPLGAYIDLRLIPVFALTLGAISLLSLFACYWPLRQYIKQPAVYSLRGAQ